MTLKISYSQTLLITDVQRDSIYNKIQRGNANAKKVILLNKSLDVCDSIKAVKTEIIGVQHIKIGKLNYIIDNLKTVNKLEKKKGRRKSFWAFVKGTGIGAFLMFIGLTI